MHKAWQVQSSSLQLYREQVIQVPNLKRVRNWQNFKRMYNPKFIPSFIPSTFLFSFIKSELSRGWKVSKATGNKAHKNIYTLCTQKWHRTSFLFKSVCLSFSIPQRTFSVFMTSQTFIATQSCVLHAMPGTHKSLQFNLWGNCPRDGESFPVLAWQRRVRAESRVRFDLSALDWNREGLRDPRRSCNLDWPQQMDGQQSDSCCNQFSLESDMNQRSSGARLRPVWVCL